MALRNQPYIPLYVQDFMTDEKLIECSAASTGVYIRIMCILHKQERYGILLLKQKYKQSSKLVENFALQLATSLPYSYDEIIICLEELLNEGVLCLDENLLYQKRMVKDNDISEKRALAGSIGGKKTTKKFAKAKNKANSEDEDVNEDVSINTGRIKNPNLEEVKSFFVENGYAEAVAEKAFLFYSEANWHDSKGKKVRNWKQKMRSVWFKDENKEKAKKPLLESEKDPTLAKW